MPNFRLITFCRGEAFAPRYATKVVYSPAADPARPPDPSTPAITAIGGCGEVDYVSPRQPRIVDSDRLPLQVFVEPVHDVLETFDAMPRLSRS